MGLNLELLQLTREAIKQGQKLEPYRDELVENTIQSILMLFDEAKSVFAEEGQQDSLFEDRGQARLVSFQHYIERNKRILLTYHFCRLRNIASVSFNSTIMPKSFSESWNSSEKNFATDCGTLYQEYFRSFSGLIDLNSSIKPPKDLFVQIRVNRDCGVVQTEWGQVYLNANTLHYLRRIDVQTLIDQGLVTHVK